MELINAYRIKELHRRPHRSMTNPHYHDSCELYFFQGDSMQYFLGSRIFTLSKNDIIVVNAFKYHRTNYTTSVDPSRINLIFPQSALDIFSDEPLKQNIADFLENETYIPAASYNEQEVLPLLEQLIYLCGQKTTQPLSETRKALLLAGILSALIDSRVGPRETESSTPVMPEKLSAVVKYLDTGFASDICLESLSERFSISRYHLCRRFRQLTGTGITEYVNHKRLFEAEKLLQKTDYPITRVSELVGFSNLSYFNRMFKKMYNVTPGEFRKQKHSKER